MRDSCFKLDSFVDTISENINIINMASLFTKIIKREIPAKIFHETDDVIVIADINPKAPVHLLVIPKTETKNFYLTPPDTLSMLNKTVLTVAEKLGLEDHFKVWIHNGFGQEIDHLHYHFHSDRGRERLRFIE